MMKRIGGFLIGVLGGLVILVIAFGLYGAIQEDAREWFVRCGTHTGAVVFQSVEADRVETMSDGVKITVGDDVILVKGAVCIFGKVPERFEKPTPAPTMPDEGASARNF
jgi:hypothetical protein